VKWFCGLIAAVLMWPAAASAQEPVGWRLDSARASRIALAVPKIREEIAEHPQTEVHVRPRLQDDRWEVSVLARDKPGLEEVAYAILDDRSARVEEAWAGIEVGWPMARGYAGAFGGRVNAPWVWIALSVLFVVPFARRRPALIHLDLAALLAFSLSYAAFNTANIDLSVPTVYPLLAYLLGRALWVAWRGPRALDLRVGEQFLFIALVFLVGFRVALTLTGGNVVDVGYAGVIGADRLTHLDALYGAFPADNLHGDTYGPVVYAAYVPFELLWPWSGEWDTLPAAQWAAAAFDLACLGLCYLLGRRFGRGLLLAYLWAAFPFTLLVLASGANDALVAALVLLTLLLAARPLARGAALALAGLSKFGPFILLPLFASVRTVIATVVVSALLLAPFDLPNFWERTLGFQNGRASPFSIWGLWELGGLHVVVQLAAIALAVAVAFVPRRRDPVTLCALTAAVLIALQIALGHWFYLYIVWWLAPFWVALLVGAGASPPAPRTIRGRDRP
jgi:hypothetical protein